MNPEGTPLEALFSIHDVMPETLAAVAGLLNEFESHALPPPALLVVPGRSWTPLALAKLKSMAAAGSELVAHGWLHETVPRSAYHRLHALLLSRKVAEHLACDSEGVRTLMRRSAAWFAEHELPQPRTYIPPAWALGVSSMALADLPFDVVETLRGVHLRTPDGFRLKALPLIGFEADTRFRALCLRRWNQLQLAKARTRRATVRIGIHPGDLELRLNQELRTVLDSRWRPVSYGSLASIAIDGSLRS